MKTLAKAASCAVIVLSCCALAFASACGSGEETEHTWDDGVTTAATCGDYGYTTYTCTGCGATKVERGAAATGNHTLVNGECSMCGYIDMNEMDEDAAISQYGFYFEDADESGTYTARDVIYFGSYPQSRVTDETTVAALAEEAGSVPTSTSAGNWTSYGYYVSGSPSDIIWYQDVTLEGVAYRGVYVADYRPYYSYLEENESYQWMSMNGITKENTYWYKFEPLAWKVLDYQNGQFFLNTKEVVDSQSYQDNASYSSADRKYYVNGTTTYANDWSASTIRTFLNSSFYGWAFSSAEQAKIQTTTLDNSTTGYKGDEDYEYASSQKDTQDKVFLLSYQDVLSEDYGFTSTAEYDASTSGVITDEDELSRMKNYSDYSLSQGLRPSTLANTADGSNVTWWLLRSYANSSAGVCGVTKNGSISYNLSSYSNNQTANTDGVVFYTSMGICPAINVKLW